MIVKQFHGKLPYTLLKTSKTKRHKRRYQNSSNKIPLHHRNNHPLPSSVSSPSSVTTPSSSSTAKSSSSSVIETTADDFNRLQNEASLEVGKSYKFTGSLVDKDLWGPDGDGAGYLIYVNSYDSKRGRNEQLLLKGSKSIANNIKNANEAEFTVKVTEDSYGDYEFNIVSAQPK